MNKIKSIRKLGKNKVDLGQISDFYKVSDYRELVKVIRCELDKGILLPIKSSGSNGKVPALHNVYKVIYEKQDNSVFIKELQYDISTLLTIDYYTKNIEKYKEDRDNILLLNAYLKKNKNLLKNTISLNERSFEIWAREKFLQREGGKTVLKNLAFSMDQLNVYETTEPLAYYSNHKNTPQNILILENKDTFYSMRKHLLTGHTDILGIPIGTLIYGAGKGIYKTFQDFTYCMEPYLTDPQNSLLYFGDLDYEGILIYEELAKTSRQPYKIKPFVIAYEAMIAKANGIDLPITKEGQNRNIAEVFLYYFNENIRQKIMGILESNQYIPQEILNFKDFGD